MMSIPQRKQYTRYTKYKIINSVNDIERYFDRRLKYAPFATDIYPLLSRLSGLQEKTLTEVFRQISEKTMTHRKSPYTALTWVPEQENFSSKTTHDRPWDYTELCDMKDREPSFYPDDGYASQQSRTKRERQIRRLETESRMRFKHTPIVEERRKPTRAQVESLLHKPRKVNRAAYTLEDKQIKVTTTGRSSVIRHKNSAFQYLHSGCFIYSMGPNCVCRIPI